MSPSPFLYWLDPSAKNFVFQTFDDKGRGWGGSTYKAPSLTEELKNLNAYSFGVGVAINELDGSIRRNENVSRIRAVWFDLDCLPEREIDFPLEPSVTVKTSPGKYHFYWLVLDTWPANSAGIEDFKAVMSRMVELGHDRQCCDPARAMRLPGSYHHKGKPFQVSVASPTDGLEPRYYRREELVQAFKPERPTEKPSMPDLDDNGACVVDMERLHFTLSFLNYDQRDIWVKLGMALKADSHLIGGETAAFNLWRDWSSQSNKFNPYEAGRQWNSFKDKGKDGVGLGSIFNFHGQNARLFTFPRDEALTPNDLPKAEAPGQSGSLAEKTLRELKATFARYDHNPSSAQWEALSDLARRLESAADGTAQPLNFLSSLDPGIGKTQTIIHFVKALLASPKHEGVSVLICLGRLAEIKSYVGDMDLDEGDYAVLVAETAENIGLNGLGTDRDKARVLFTTQQMLESRVKRQGSFAAVSEFWFDGKPRQVRLWDESCLPARPLTVDVTEIEGLTECARKIPAFLELLDKLIGEIKAAKSGECVSIPDFEMESDIPVASALGLYVDEKPAKQNILRDLYLLQGNTVTVSRDGSNRTVIHYEDTLPDDLKPVIICDASGRVRQTYPHWAQGRGDLVGLASAPKDYDDLTIHLWKHAGSKTAWNDKAQATEMLRAIVEVVNSKPNEEFLIIHHMVKGSRSIDLPAYVETSATDPERLHFTHWNSEDCKATNQFKDVPNIILAGTLFYPSSYYEALGKLSRALAPAERLSKQHRKEIELGEYAHLILQAVCRGTARKAIGNKSGKADVWIIATEKSGIPSLLGSIFPRSKTVPWMPVASTGRVGDAINA